MLKKILIVIVLAVAAVLLYAATLPDSFRVERSVQIAASSQAIFPHLNSPANQRAWSPWEKKDPDMQRTYSGPAAGEGAVYEWSGDSNIGSGRMTITESVPSSKLVMSLEFLEPMEAHNTAEFLLSSANSGTQVTWAIYGPMPYPSKLFSLFCDMDQMVGREFEKGLADLKMLVEGNQ